MAFKVTAGSQCHGLKRKTGWRELRQVLLEGGERVNRKV
jgi:hypothetical protein